MSYILDLQQQGTDRAEARWISSWSLIGCASTLSVGAC